MKRDPPFRWVSSTPLVDLLKSLADRGAIGSDFDPRALEGFFLDPDGKPLTFGLRKLPQHAERPLIPWIWPQDLLVYSFESLLKKCALCETGNASWRWVAVSCIFVKPNGAFFSPDSLSHAFRNYRDFGIDGKPKHYEKIDEIMDQVPGDEGRSCKCL